MSEYTGRDKLTDETLKRFAEVKPSVEVEKLSHAKKLATALLERDVDFTVEHGEDECGAFYRFSVAHDEMGVLFYELNRACTRRGR